eukprot:m51a1_g3875 hypothetical protein (343) ;mRNA; r:24328-26152
MVKVCRQAPDWSGKTAVVNGNATSTVSLSDWRNNNRCLVMVFFRGAATTDQRAHSKDWILSLSKNYSKFTAKSCDIVALSNSTAAQYQDWQLGVGGIGALPQLKLICDVGDAIGTAYNPQYPVPRKSVFVINQSGVVVAEMAYAADRLTLLPSIDELLRIYEASAVVAENGSLVFDDSVANPVRCIKHPGPFLSVYSAPNNQGVCALTESGHVVCHRLESGVCKVVPGTPTHGGFDSLAAHTITHANVWMARLASNYSVEVWGDPIYAVLRSAPDVEGGWLDISVTIDHGCGIRRSDGAVVFWGGDPTGECLLPLPRMLAPPPENHDFVQVATGSCFHVGAV